MLHQTEYMQFVLHWSGISKLFCICLDILKNTQKRICSQLTWAEVEKVLKLNFHEMFSWSHIIQISCEATMFYHKFITYFSSLQSAMMKPLKLLTRINCSTRSHFIFIISHPFTLRYWTSIYICQCFSRRKWIANEKKTQIKLICSFIQISFSILFIKVCIAFAFQFFSSWFFYIIENL